ncbi:flavin reductase family protein [Kutzneria sp. 744]|uniref:flavin reductase family protein n=1 Tax=Kutzneria sp. (strain 744) TaxID=345341 RepID=UPI0003EEC8CF|nr:flavin reductase family protein [Kutzneria sp. 744]EWM18729.1 nitrilotriacetate monooxygenase component B [Kutzneria sp. 744]
MTATLDPTLAEACREYYRKLTAGVAVVTACGPSGWSGTTVSTVTSVSLRPPILLCCMTLDSRTLTAIRHAGCFAVHLLADDQPDLADRFSRSPSDSTRFADLGYEVRLVDGRPVISGALAVAWCELHDSTQVGDHQVVYGRVSGVRIGRGRPLAWHDRAYQALVPGGHR